MSQLDPGPAVLPTEVLLGWRDEKRAVGRILVPAAVVHSDHAPGLVHVALVQGLDVRIARGVAHDGARHGHDAPLGVLGHPLDRQCCKKDQIPTPQLLERDT